MTRGKKTTGGQASVEDQEHPEPGGEGAASPPQADEPSDSLHDTLLQLFRLKDTEFDLDTVGTIVNGSMVALLKKSPVAAGYNVLFLNDTTSLQRSDADRIYRALRKCDSDRPLLLLLSSDGGNVSAAYFVGKLCRERSNGRFVVAVPRRAKSGATMICCAADEIHMGSLSELGPIDPQLEGVPALALKHSVEHLADLTRQYPSASEMFASYLAKALRIEELGYYERVAESAVQYAERLLRSRTVPGVPDPAAIAHRLVYSYKDHGFVIDAREATEIFGDEVVQLNTQEYDLANDAYSRLDLLRSVCGDFLKVRFYFTGSPDDGASLTWAAPPASPSLG